MYMVVVLLLLVGIIPSGMADTTAAGADSGGAMGMETILMDEEQGMRLYDLLVSGGWVMGVLALLSVMAVTLAIYYFLSLTQKKLIPGDLVTQVLHFARDQRGEEIVRLCKRHTGMFAKVMLSGASRCPTDSKTLMSAMEASGRREGEALLRKVRYLSDIATVAPMLGLLGTVLGMISAFNFIAFDMSAVKPVALASAVAQALVTTAAGLIIAIPSMALFYYFRSKVEDSIGRMEEVATEVADTLGKTQPAPARTVRKTAAKTTRPKTVSS